MDLITNYLTADKGGSYQPHDPLCFLIFRRSDTCKNTNSLYFYFIAYLIPHPPKKSEATYIDKILRKTRCRLEPRQSRPGLDGLIGQDELGMWL